MGMYDNIKIKQQIPLPQEIKKLGIDWLDYTFQTKSLDNCLTDYWISETGELFEHVVQREYIPFSKEERVSKKSKPWEIWKEVIDKNEFDNKIDFHGKINFYTYEKLNETEDFFLEFDAYFSYGKLDKIEIIRFTKDKSLALRNEEIFAEQEKLQNTFWNKFRKNANCFGWSFFWSKTARLFSKISIFFNNIYLFIYRHII